MRPAREAIERRRATVDLAWATPAQAAETRCRRARSPQARKVTRPILHALKARQRDGRAAEIPRTSRKAPTARATRARRRALKAKPTASRTRAPRAPRTAPAATASRITLPRARAQANPALAGLTLARTRATTPRAVAASH